MYKVEIISDGKSKTVFAQKGSILANVLNENKAMVEHPCGFKGVCKKCMVLVNGREELSCRYAVNSDISVTVFSKKEIKSETGAEESNKITQNMCLAFDIGTTTLALMLVSLDDKRIVKSIVKTNPQRTFSSDVMSRIDYSVKMGTKPLYEAVIDALNSMIKEIFEMYGLKHIEKLYVSGNMTMLHLFLNLPCESMGVSPYKAPFLESRTVSGKSIGAENVDSVITLPGIHAFVGADIVAGLGYVGMPDRGYNILIDLGTNAEVAIFTDKKLLATAAAAGPCFEGVNISSGMSATEGAIYSYDGENFHVIGNKKPVGICATGLIDIIAELLNKGVIDESGYMECKEYKLLENVSITQEDIRQFQLAKSAIFSATEVLKKRMGVTPNDIERVYVSGGFSTKLNIENAITTGLFSKDMKDKFVMINNSSLLGTVKYALEHNDLDIYTQNAEYIDLSTDEDFCNLYIENMMF